MLSLYCSIDYFHITPLPLTFSPLIRHYAIIIIDIIDIYWYATLIIIIELIITPLILMLMIRYWFSLMLMPLFHWLLLNIDTLLYAEPCHIDAIDAITLSYISYDDDIDYYIIDISLGCHIHIIIDITIIIAITIFRFHYFSLTLLLISHWYYAIAIDFSLWHIFISHFSLFSMTLLIRFFDIDIDILLRHDFSLFSLRH
jgi:hypothetical protein